MNERPLLAQIALYVPIVLSKDINRLQDLHPLSC